jgi:hypothetical protein
MLLMTKKYIGGYNLGQLIWAVFWTSRSMSMTVKMNSEEMSAKRKAVMSMFSKGEHPVGKSNETVQIFRA